MKFLKLAFISLAAFALLLWVFSLLFPSNTIISRVGQVKKTNEDLISAFKSNEISLQYLLAGHQDGWVVKSADIPFYVDNLFNITSTEAVPEADTIFFSVSAKNGRNPVHGGLAVYSLSSDSTAVQVFVVLQTPWYNPIAKMKLMVAENAYAPFADSALHRLKYVVHSGRY
jgi:hypothetical protein